MLCDKHSAQTWVESDLFCAQRGDNDNEGEGEIFDSAKGNAQRRHQMLGLVFSIVAESRYEMVSR